MILRMFKMIATSSYLTALECIKFVFAYSPPLKPLAGLRGPTSKGEGEGKRKDRGEEKRKRRGGTGLPFRKFLDPPL